MSDLIARLREQTDGCKCDTCLLMLEAGDALEAAAAKVPEGATLIDAKFLARDIHHALCDDGLAPLSPTDCNAMRDVITRTILKARPAP